MIKSSGGSDVGTQLEDGRDDMVRSLSSLAIKRLEKRGYARSHFTVELSSQSNPIMYLLKMMGFVTCMATFIVFSVVTIISTALSFQGKRLFLTLDFLLLWKGLQLTFFFERMMSDGDKGLRRMGYILAIVGVSLAGLTYSLFFNAPLDAISYVNFTMEDPLLSVIPVVILAGIAFSFIKNGTKKVSAVLRKKSINKYFYRIYFSIMAMFAVKLVLFNIKGLTLNPMVEWMILSAVTAIFLILSRKLMKLY